MRHLYSHRAHAGIARLVTAGHVKRVGAAIQDATAFRAKLRGQRPHDSCVVRRVSIGAAVVGLVEVVAPGLIRSLLPLDRAGLRLGRVALVSGSGRGIGREIALKLASEGARLVINDLDADPGELIDRATDPECETHLRRLSDAHFHWSRKHHTRTTVTGPQMDVRAEKQEPHGIYIGLWDEADLKATNKILPDKASG